MLSNVKNVFKVTDLRNKILFVLAMVALYVFGFQLAWFPLGHAYADDLTPGLNLPFVARQRTASRRLS